MGRREATLGAQMEFMVPVHLSAEHIVNSDNDYDEIIQFIKDVDAGIGDWDFTLKLCKHFGELRSQWEKEEFGD
jgi:hypothetical protein